MADHNLHLGTWVRFGYAESLTGGEYNLRENAEVRSQILSKRVILLLCYLVVQVESQPECKPLALNQRKLSHPPATPLTSGFPFRS